METITELFTTSKLNENQQKPLHPSDSTNHFSSSHGWQVAMCTLTFSFILCVYAEQDRKRLGSGRLLHSLSLRLTIRHFRDCACERDTFMWVVNAKVSALSFGCKQNTECLYADVFFILYFSGVHLLHTD